MVLMIMFSLSSEMILSSNTSKPSLNGTRTRFSFWNCGLPCSLVNASEISNLAALLPISIAANRIYFNFNFIELLQVIIYFFLRPDTIISISFNITVAQLVVEYSCLYVVCQLYIKNVD